MKKIICVLFVFLACTACSYSTVPPGNVGVKVYLLGKSKGVDMEALPVGRYWLGWNEKLYLFPTFEQNYVWTMSGNEGSANDESITFQDKNGTIINGDFGITYHIDPEKVTNVFQKYRRGVDEITDIFLRNHVRDALNKIASQMSIDEIYGEKKASFIEQALTIVQNEVKPIGIDVSKIYSIGAFRLPSTVMAALNAKVTATQKAQQSENELREAEAEAKKTVAIAQGTADAILEQAKAQAEANDILAKSLTPELVEYKKIEKWNGSLPQVSGANTLINFKENN